MKKYIIIILIFVLALFLRFYNLGDFRCLNWDEAAFGYNAYSIVETGKDEYGESFPLQFKSVGDYKAPLYIYLTAPIIKVLGLNEFSVRFMPAFLGSATVVVFYLLSNFLINKKFTKWNLPFGVVPAFFLAISPWHIQFTKAGADVGVSTFFTILGIYGFLKGTKGSRWGFVLGAFGFTSAIYSYFSERLFIPLIAIFSALFFKKEIAKTKNNFLFGILFGLVFLLPILPSLFSGGHEEKILKTTLFGYERSSEYISLIKNEDKSHILYSLFHGAFLENFSTALVHYFNHFSPTFLFFKGVFFDPRQVVERMGLLYLFDLPLILYGFNYLIKTKNKFKFFILGWLLLAPIPAAITKDEVSARRSLNMVYPLLIISSVGLLGLWEKFKNIAAIVFLGLCVHGMAFYLISYYLLTPPTGYAGPSGWSCGYKELVHFMQKYKGEGTEIIVDTSYQGPYLYFLFYEKYSPQQYQRQSKLIQDNSGILGEGSGYDNYVFRPVYWPNDRCELNKIIAAPPERLPDRDLDPLQIEILGKIYFPDGKEAFRIVKTIKEPTGGYCEKLFRAKI